MNFGLLFTFVVGFSIMLGALVILKTKNTDKIVTFSISIALGVFVSLAFLELIPEAYELFYPNYKMGKSILLIIASGLVGFGILKILDRFIPEHHEHKKAKKVHKKNLFHIGVVSSVALIIHNIIEGMALYSVAILDAKAGVLMTLGIGLHNIPMGMILTSTFYKGNQDKKKTLLLLGGISLSTFIGGIFVFLFEGIISEFMLGILLGITLGMIVYLSFLEFIPHIQKSKDKKNAYMGILLGISILLISLVF